MDAQERKGLVTMAGAPLSLLGPDVNVGDTAPDFRAVDAGFKPVKLADFKGRACLISAVPSLDTGVCAAQTKRFNDEVKNLPPGIAVITISMDLPFAQKRWCGAAGVDKVKVVSDYRAAEFGEKYGVLIKELHLLARSLFVIDRDGVVRYTQIVSENGDEPDYEPVLEAAKGLA